MRRRRSQISRVWPGAAVGPRPGPASSGSIRSGPSAQRPGRGGAWAGLLCPSPVVPPCSAGLCLPGSGHGENVRLQALGEEEDQEEERGVHGPQREADPGEGQQPICGECPGLSDRPPAGDRGFCPLGSRWPSSAAAPHHPGDGMQLEEYLPRGSQAPPCIPARLWVLGQCRPVTEQAWLPCVWDRASVLQDHLAHCSVD